MREILFRGKKLWDGEWVEGYYVHISEGEGTYDREHHYIQTDYKGRLGPRYEIVPETQGEFIGQKDKNGRKVFEGDICAKRDYFDRLILLEIGYEDASFCYRHIGNTKYWTPIDDNEYGIVISNLEVIGNIHDDPNYVRSEKKEEPYET